MRKFPMLVGTALALLLTASPATAEPVSECPVLVPPPTAEDMERYLCGDSRLGPADLPEEGPVGSLVEGYDRLGGLSRPSSWTAGGPLTAAGTTRNTTASRWPTASP